MACYSPMYLKFTDYSDDGTPHYQITGKYCGFLSDPRDKMCPCGQCIGCRLDKSRQWADRMILELDHTKKAVFVTLTYDPQHVPIGMFTDGGTPIYTLYKKDLQDFMKRLRKRFTGKEIRFYASGEYGSNTARPHYHVILFGLSLDDFPDREVSGRNEFNQPWYGSSFLDSVWNNGFTSLANVTWSTCAYVARYVMKKQTGDAAMVYAENNISPEFSLMSRRPGIAGYYFQDHPEDFGETIFYVNDGAITKKPITKVSCPKYLLKMLDMVDSELYTEIKLKRSQYADDKLLMELSRTDLGFVEYLENKRIGKEKAIQGLPRGL